MPAYVVNHAYRAGVLGPWQAGDVIELDDATAAHVEHDSPGCLSAHVPAPVVVERAVERAVEDHPDKMVRARRTKAVG